MWEPAATVAPQSTSDLFADVVIVGAGLAGLSAAQSLVARGISVIVLEARERVGGRMFSYPMGHERVDLGAQWIGPTQERIMQLAHKLHIQMFPQYHRGRKVLELNGRLSFYRNTVPALPLPSLLELRWTIRQIERLCRQVPLDRPFTAAHAQEWDQITVEQWMQRHVRTSDARSVLGSAVRALLAAEPRAISFLHFLFYVHSGGGFVRLIKVRRGAQQYRLVGGAQQIAQRLADELGERVILQAAVRVIEQDDAGVTVHSATGTYRGQRIIVAVPPILARQIDYLPALPPPRQQLTRRMLMGSVIKCVIAYQHPFWRDAGLSGEVLSNTSPIQLVFDDSAYDGAFGALVVFILGAVARQQSQHPITDRATMVRNELTRFFGPQAASPVAYVDQDWTTETWTRGGYVGFMPPETQTTYGEALRMPVGRIHWAGTETAQVWNGYMEGAIESGERAADEVSAHIQLTHAPTIPTTNVT